MKMSALVLMLVAGLGGWAWLIRRHRQSVPAEAPLVVRQIEDLRPVEAWPQIVIIAPATGVHWREKLRREEQRQRPQEGRN
jgi:hypothetical protein